MDLDFYLWKNKIKQKDFAKRLGITAANLSLLQSRAVSPSTVAALIIHLETNGEVSLVDLLKDKDRVRFKDYLKRQPSEKQLAIKAQTFDSFLQAPQSPGEENSQKFKIS